MLHILVNDVYTNTVCIFIQIYVCLFFINSFSFYCMCYIVYLIAVYPLPTSYPFKHPHLLSITFSIFLLKSCMKQNIKPVYEPVYTKHFGNGIDIYTFWFLEPSDIHRHVWSVCCLKCRQCSDNAAVHWESLLGCLPFAFHHCLVMSLYE